MDLEIELLLIALLPATLMLVLVLLTKKTVLSLGSGILLACIINLGINLTSDTPDFIGTFTDMLSAFGETILGSFEIMFFLLVLGIVTSIVTISGGTTAFGVWVGSKVKSAKSAQFIPFITGILIFIDDYFNALVVGEVAKPITDQQKVSRAKLSYIIDSTAAPVVVLIPFSTWSVYVLTQLNNSVGVANGNDLLVSSLPYLFYPLAALIGVLLVITFTINIGSMKTYEEQAAAGNDTSVQATDAIHKLNDLKENNGSPLTLVLPLAALILGAFGFMFIEMFVNWNITGELMSILDTNMVRGLVIGSILSLLVVTILVLKQGIGIDKYRQATTVGLLETIPTLIILTLAFSTATAFDFLDLSSHVGALMETTNISTTFLPVVLFLAAGGLSFATGSSWGTFAILIPTIIAPLFAIGTDAAVVSMTTAAIISGGVWGDHCSPISDTTILSSTGSNCKLEAHFESQLPYALIIGGLSAISFLLAGITGSFVIPLLFTIVGLAGLVIAYKTFLED